MTESEPLPETIDIEKIHPDILKALEERMEDIEEGLRYAHDGEIIVICETEFDILYPLLEKRKLDYETCKQQMLENIGYGGMMGKAWHEPIKKHFDVAWLKYATLVGYEDVDKFKEHVTYPDIREVPKNIR